jgi:hypothetical protein
MEELGLHFTRQTVDMARVLAITPVVILACLTSMAAKFSSSTGMFCFKAERSPDFSKISLDRR